MSVWDKTRTLADGDIEYDACWFDDCSENASKSVVTKFQTKTELLK